MYFVIITMVTMLLQKYLGHCWLFVTQSTVVHRMLLLIFISNLFHLYTHFCSCSLQLGGGTAAPGITAAKCGALVTLTDADSPRLMDHLMETCRLNNMEDVQVLPLTWGTFSEELLSLPPVDYILASDCLYQSTSEWKGL